MTIKQSSLGIFGIFISTFFILVGVLMLGPLLLFLLKQQGVSNTISGVFGATGMLGILMVTPFVSWITKTLGKKNTMILSAGVPCLAAAGVILSNSIPIWFVLELLAGMAGGVRWILAESLIAELAPTEKRGRYIGIFETLVGATFFIGPAVLALLGAGIQALYFVFFTMLVGWLATLFIPPLPGNHENSAASFGIKGILNALTAHPLVMCAGLLGGFFESGLSTFLPLLGLSIQLGEVGSTWLVAASGLGSAVMMIPVGLLSDKMIQRAETQQQSIAHTRWVLLKWCAILNAALSCLLPIIFYWPHSSYTIAFLWGGVGGCLYTLSMINVGSSTRGNELINATAVLVLAYTTGGVLAPFLGGIFLDVSPQIGVTALFVVTGFLGLFAVYKFKSET